MRIKIAGLAILTALSAGAQVQRGNWDGTVTSGSLTATVKTYYGEKSLFVVTPTSADPSVKMFLVRITVRRPIEPAVELRLVPVAPEHPRGSTLPNSAVFTVNSLDVLSLEIQELQAMTVWSSNPQAFR